MTSSPQKANPKIITRVELFGRKLPDGGFELGCYPADPAPGFPNEIIFAGAVYRFVSVRDNEVPADHPGAGICWGSYEKAVGDTASGRSVAQNHVAGFDIVGTRTQDGMIRLGHGRKVKDFPEEVTFDGFEYTLEVVDDEGAGTLRACYV